MNTTRTLVKVTAVILFLSAVSTSWAQYTRTNVAELSIEDLVNLQITSVSKKQTPLAQSPAAIAVLTADDIRRIGAQSIPEALRVIPGLDVAQLSANRWAVSSRGFNDEYANKLLVLVDGRTVYTPTFGGVYWNSEDVVLEDLDRIEVIRGPGATLWGANAVNGVINIITKSAKETQGGLVAADYGTEDQPSVTARYGGQITTNLFYRVYVKYFNRDGFDDTHGHSMDDNWNVARSGFRMDWEPDDKNTFTLLGDYYDGSYGEQVGKTAAVPATSAILGIQAPISGGDLLGRWTHEFSEQSDLKVQVYYDHYQRGDPYGGGIIMATPTSFLDSENIMHERRDTWDLDIQHRFPIGNRNDIVWGLGYRRTSDWIGSDGVAITWDIKHEDDDLYSAFVQDEITVVEDKLNVTIGSKFEHNVDTGFEFEPSGRIAWTPTEHQTIWGSIARAVRTPTRLENDARVDITSFQSMFGPGLASSFGNPNLGSEQVLAYELGYRFEPIRKLSFDITAFYNDYNLAYSQPGTPGLDPDPNPFPHFVAPYYYTNNIKGSTYGVELLAQWQATERWRLSASYSWLHTSFAGNLLAAQSSPEHQFNVRSSLDLGRGWEFDSTLYYVDQVKSQSQNVTGSFTTIPAYVRLDLGLTWRPNDHLEFSVWGQNLSDGGHTEFASYKTPNVAEVPRSIFGKVTWRF